MTSLDFSPDSHDVHHQLRVIDVCDACIVFLPAGAAYVALSYQRGAIKKSKLIADNEECQCTPGALSTPLGRPSRTIVDAMTTTERLDYRYLRVDALCTEQDNPEDLDRNISMMDRISRQADLTIIAVAGENAEHGLAGVSLARTERQISTTVKGIAIANMLEAAAGAITFSRWNTRGWTYQERLLSRRLLTFTDSQVYYHCDQRYNFQEKSRIESITPDKLDHRAYFDFEDQNIWEMYAVGVAQYTMRSLTKSGDRLQAFSGMTSFLTQLYGAPFFYGLPMALFDVAMLWHPTRPSDRGESSIPSWFWSGWTGADMYKPAETMNNMCKCTISQADIYTIPEHVQLCSNITKEEGSSFSNRDTPSWSRGFDDDLLRVSYRRPGKNCEKIEYPQPLPMVNASATSKALEKASMVLRVFGQTAMLRLTDRPSSQMEYLPRWKESCKRGKHVLCHLAILDDQNHWAATVQVDGSLVSQLQNKAHCFLALSRSSTLYCIDEDLSWDAETTTYRHWTTKVSLPSRPALLTMNRPMISLTGTHLMHESGGRPLMFHCFPSPTKMESLRGSALEEYM